MKKMPCLFVRRFHGAREFTLTEEVTPGCEWVLAGEGIATRKWDGTACMVKGDALFKRMGPPRLGCAAMRKDFCDKYHRCEGYADPRCRGNNCTAHCNEHCGEDCRGS